MRVLCLLPLLLLVAAAQAQIFEIARGTTVYSVRGAVTTGSPQLTSEKSALEYQGNVAVQKTGNGAYLLQFQTFKVNKYDALHRSVEDQSFESSEESKEQESANYEREIKKPVKAYFQNGEVVRLEAQKDQKEWATNIYRAVLTLLQNQVQSAHQQQVPVIEYHYEQGISGNCKVQYEVLSQPDEIYQSGEVFNVTKTNYFKDCKGPRPVYLSFKSNPRACAGVCSKHQPENFLPQYDEEKTDFESNPTPGCPMNRKPTSTIVTVHQISQYNVSNGMLDEAQSDSFDIYRLYSGEIEVRTRLELEALSQQGSHVQEPQGQTQMYNDLNMQLPEESEKLDIPIFSLLLEESTNIPDRFKKHLTAAVQQLQQLNQQTTDDKPEPINNYVLQLVQAMSAMTTEEIRSTIPSSLSQKQTQGLSQEQQLKRQLWIDVLAKGGSKAAINVALQLIKQQTLSPGEIRRILQDIAAFQSYPDTDVIQQLLPLCLDQQDQLTATGQATACATLGKIINKACRSKINEEPYAQQKEQRADRKKQRSHQQQQQQQQSSSSSSEESNEVHIENRNAIPQQKRCQPEQLQQYVQQLKSALQSANNFQEQVALINALSKIGKPEVLPALRKYVEGTANNMVKAADNDEDEEEAVEFLRQVAIISLHDVVRYYPKEVNPLVRVIFHNVSEEVQTRILAFDVWMRSQPAQWEVRKAIEIANEDESQELTNYVHTALMAASKSKAPCDQILARRINAVWDIVYPANRGMQYSHVYSAGYFDQRKDTGSRVFKKFVASNSSAFPLYSSVHLRKQRGPFKKVPLGAKVLVKGADKLWQQIVGNHGILDQLSAATDGRANMRSQQQQQHMQSSRQHQKILNDIAKELNLDDVDDETPKAVLFWKIYSGEAIIPIDRKYIQELKQELVQYVYRITQKGINAHFVRVLMPTKAYQVEPSAVGLPVIHYTLQPVIVSIKVENLKIEYDNQDNKAAPEKLELKGTIQPTIISQRQSSVSVIDEEGEKSPSVKVNNYKEFNARVQFQIKYDRQQKKLKLKVQPQFDRVLLNAHCVQIALDEQDLIDQQPDQDFLNYKQCVKTMPAPFHIKKTLESRAIGMGLKITGTSHRPWAGLPVYGSPEHQRLGLFGAFLKKFENQGWQHRVYSVYLRPHSQQPINQWTLTLDFDDNISELVKIPIEQQKQQALKLALRSLAKDLMDESSSSSSSSSGNSGSSSESQEDQDSQLQSVIQKVNNLLKKTQDQMEKTAIERQLVVLADGFYQGQQKKSIRVALKKVQSFDKTEQHFALVAESQLNHKAIELHGNFSFPVIDSPFSYKPSYFGADQMNATLVLSVVEKDSRTPRETYVVQFNATKTEEQREGIQDERSQVQKKWFEVKCMAQQKAGHTVSDACLKANLKDNSLDQMEMLISLPKQVSPRVQQLANKFLTFIKYKYWHRQHSDISNVEDNEDDQIYISANATRVSPWSLLYNARVNMPNENLYLSNIRVPLVRPPHMQLTLKEQLKYVVYKGQKEVPCGLGKKTVHTFDNVSFPLDVRSHCKYLLTRDVRVPSDFNVVFEVLDKTVYSKKIYVQLQNTVIEIPPPLFDTPQVDLIVNGARHTITDKTPLVIPYGQNKKVFVLVRDSANPHDAPVVHVRTENKRFHLYFDGFSAYVFVDSHYKGDTKGICGNNDNEQAHEFIGPRGEEYEESNEFIASYGLGQQCQQPVESTKKQYIEEYEAELEKQQIQQILRKQKQQQHGSQESSEEQQQQHLRKQKQQRGSQQSSEEQQQYLRKQKQQKQQRGNQQSSEEQQLFPRKQKQQRGSQESSEEQQQQHLRKQKQQRGNQQSSEEQQQKFLRKQKQQRGSQQSSEEQQQQKFLRKQMQQRGSQESSEEQQQYRMKGQKRHSAENSNERHWRKQQQKKQQDSSEESLEKRIQSRRQQYKSQGKQTSSEEEMQWLKQQRRNQKSSSRSQQQQQQLSQSAEDRVLALLRKQTLNSKEQQEALELLNSQQLQSRQQQQLRRSLRKQQLNSQEQQQQHKNRRQQRQSQESQESMSNEQQQQECTQLRTIIRSVNNDICFSRQPVLMCQKQCRKAKGSKTENVTFVCLNKESQETKEMLRQIKKQGTIQQSSSLAIDMVEEVRIPEKCVRI